MYNQRTSPAYQKIRATIAQGELGEIKRMSWVVTDWYRPQSYYDLGQWRATWAGEGGGVLLNQAPHQLDLWQWMLGMMPVRLRAFMAFGKYHGIEVEDDVTAYAEYANGATATFITSTGEAPGTNRLEIAADRGKLVAENGHITFWKLDIPERQFNREYRGGHGHPRSERREVLVPPGEPNPVHGPETGHRGITQNWVNAIRHGEPLLAPGEDGIRGLELSNAMHLSSWTDSWVALPIDGDQFEAFLREKMANSRGIGWNI
jgi:predicted dehydrogenase